MLAVLISFLLTLRGLVRSRVALHVEVLALRHQLQVLQRSRPRRLRLMKADRWLWTWLSQAWPSWRTALVIVKPETVRAWHRHGLRLWWTWKSRRRIGRPSVPANVRALIRNLSQANPLWGAPRIHGEVMKLGLDVCQASVAKSMMRRKAAITDVADIPGEPCPATRRRGLLRGTDSDLPSLVRARDPRARAPTYRAHRGDRSSDGRLDRATTPRSVSVG